MSVDQLKAAMLEIRERVDALPAVEVGDGFTQAGASFTSLAQGTNNPRVIAAAQELARIAAFGQEIILNAEIVHMEINAAVESF